MKVIKKIEEISISEWNDMDLKTFEILSGTKKCNLCGNQIDEKEWFDTCESCMNTQWDR